MDNYLLVGTIATTHALKGEVKVYSTTDFKDERYKPGSVLFIECGGEYKKLTVKSHRVHQNFDLLSFEGYDDINKILPFVKCGLYVNADALDELPDDEYYYYELIGCEVFSDSKYIGKVERVVNYGASDILVIKNDEDKEIMIPFVDDFIEEVDSEKQKIMIHEVEGLL